MYMDSFTDYIVCVGFDDLDQNMNGPDVHGEPISPSGHKSYYSGMTKNPESDAARARNILGCSSPTKELHQHVYDGAYKYEGPY